jgi:chromosome segregation ATPase
MDYYLNRINVVLIVLVGGLCVYQWTGEKQADAQLVELRRVVHADENHLASQAEAIRTASADLDEFKKIITEFKSKSDAANLQIRQTKAKIFTLEQETKRQATEAETAARSLAAYKQGVAARDANIQVLLGQRDQLVTANHEVVKKADQAIGAYQELANKYTALVGQYNDLAGRYKAEHAAAAKSPPAS